MFVFTIKPDNQVVHHYEARMFMPNIMLTYRCNLKCPYCFANEFVNKESTDISLEAFDKACEFLTRDAPAYIGLIGGEPTLHRDFRTILQRIINNKLIQECVVYTNGLELNRFVHELTTPKFRMLVNCNSPKVTGQAAYQRLVQNLDSFIQVYYMGDRINLGINYYDDNMDYSYILELLKRYDLHRVRLSLTVPDFGNEEHPEALDSFLKRKEGLLKLLHVFDDHGIVPYYDCNKPPYCIWNDEEKAWLNSYVEKYGVKESNLIGFQSVCYPVMDILPTLEVVRCFGMSTFEKVHIDDFLSITDIAAYFLSRIDSEAYRIAGSASCNDCYHRVTRHCLAGCIGYKSEKIRLMNNHNDAINIMEKAT